MAMVSYSIDITVIDTLNNDFAGSLEESSSPSSRGPNHSD